MKNGVLILFTLILSYSANGQLIEKGLYENALFFQRQGDFEKAIKLLNEYIEINAFDHNAYLRRAMLHDEMGQNNLMIQDLETANFINPFGHLLYNKNQRKQLLEKRNFNYQLVSSANNTDIESFKKSPLTIHYYEKLIDNNLQTQEDSLLNLAIENIDLGYFNDAKNILEKIKNNPITEKIVWDLKGIMKFKQEEFKTAINYFTKAIEIDSAFAIAYHNRSLCYKMIGEYETAEKDLDSAIEINNNYSQFYFTKALLNEYMDKENEAIKYYQKAIDKNEYYSEAIINYSVLLKKLGRYQESVIEINKAINIDPDKIENYFQRANINLIYGEYENAIEDFQTYLAEINNDGLAYFNLGLTYTLIGDKEKGCEAFTNSRKNGFTPKKEFIRFTCQ